MDTSIGCVPNDEIVNRINPTPVVCEINKRLTILLSTTVFS
jgi:hypothetical protein